MQQPTFTTKLLCTFFILVFMLFAAPLLAQNTTAISIPSDGQNFYIGEVVHIEATVSLNDVGYLHITNELSGWRKLKVGYDTANLWFPFQDVVAGGNDLLEIVLKDFTGNTQWNKLQIRPQAYGIDPIIISDYIDDAQDLGDGWLRLSIPLADFSSDINFEAISYIELPYSVNADAFEIGIKEVLFTGGSTPFLWLGDTKNDNAHDGSETNGGNLEATYIPANDSILYIEFYADGLFLGADSIAPYTYTWLNASPATYNLSAITYTSCCVLPTETEHTMHVLDTPGFPFVVITQPDDDEEFVATHSIMLSAQVFAESPTMAVLNPYSSPVRPIPNAHWAGPKVGIFGTPDLLTPITRVEFFDGDVKIAEVTEAPYIYEWDNVSPGNHYVRAIMSNGDKADTSDLINIMVLPEPYFLEVTVTFDSIPSSVSVEKAPLKYNKDFAYSFTLDDGLLDAYTVAYPFLNGGLVAGNGINYAGLYYTDGCGNDLPFKAGLAISSVNSFDIDLHYPPNGSYLTWEQLDELYNADWGIFNHSYAHKSRGWTSGVLNPPLPDSVYVAEIVENQSYVNAQTADNINMTHFVVPGGDDAYYTPAFNNGMKAVYNQHWTLPGNGTGLLIDGAVTLDNFLLNRHSLSDNSATIADKIDAVAAASTNGTHYWWNDFTHSVGSFSGPVGGGLQFSTFESYMNHIANQYGKNGADNIWMAPLQEVHEYIASSQAAIVHTQLDSNQLIITVDATNVPLDLLRYALSLTIDADVSFSDVQVVGTSSFTFNGTDSTKLINLEWAGSPSSAKNENTNQTPQTLSFPFPLKNELHIYPNPANKVVHIDLGNITGQTAHIQLFTQTGKRCAIQTVDMVKGQSILNFNLSQYDIMPGLYFLEVLVDGKRLKREKLVIR